MPDVFAPTDLQQFVDIPDETYICSRCSCFLRPPVVQTKTCGHRFCRVCWDVLFPNGGSTRVNCPGNDGCQHVLTYNAFHKDRAVSKELERMWVYCSNKKDGCNFQSQWIKISTHEQSCQHSTQRRNVQHSTERAPKLDQAQVMPTRVSVEWERKLHEQIQERPNIQNWTISNFNSLRQSSFEEKTLSPQTLSFYSSEHGYHVQAKFFPNGSHLHSSRYGTLCALHFSLLVGKHDNTLSWPFSKNIRYEILCDDDSSIDRTYITNPSNVVYKKPYGEEMCFGIEHLISHDKLTGCLKNDSLRFRIRCVEPKWHFKRR